MRFFTMLAMMAALMIGAGTITGCGGDGKKDGTSGAKDAPAKDAKPAPAKDAKPAPAKDAKPEPAK